jgi:hypothetical protein
MVTQAEEGKKEDCVRCVVIVCCGFEFKVDKIITVKLRLSKGSRNEVFQHARKMQIEKRTPRKHHDSEAKCTHVCTEMIRAQ